MSSQIIIKKFSDIPINDSFFDSLKNDYQEFESWFIGKSDETAYVQYSDGKIVGFMYLKSEDNEIDDIVPHLPAGKRIKIGSFKVDAHGTKLGERLLKKAFDTAIASKSIQLYVTIFPKHNALIQLLEAFGFFIFGTKTSINGEERVFIKNIDVSNITGNLRKDYPLINTRAVQSYILAIQPKYHSKLFPDSILNNENYDFLSDVSHTNSISKTYVCSMADVNRLHTGDLLVIYRTADESGPAEYRSVVTSICTVEEMKSKRSFSCFDDFNKYTEPFSVFDNSELRNWWNTRKDLFVIKMLYNAALTKRVIRKSLIEDIGLRRDIYWGFVPLQTDQFLNICHLGGIDGRIIVH